MRDLKFFGYIFQVVRRTYIFFTRARQGMVIVVPKGDDEDATRKKEYYDGKFDYLRNKEINIL
ncbi:MAG: hypothetical protein M3Z26_03855 [Bacteroidota bacterium]|nr:hypothetical protein [Bacteroidota bacterium]